jgi:hypothetical protein
LCSSCLRGEAHAEGAGVKAAQRSAARLERRRSGRSRALTQERAQRTLRRLQAGRTAAARCRPGERLPSGAHPRGLPGHGKPSTASRSAAHSPASERPLDLPWERSDTRGVWGHVATTRSTCYRQHRVRHARAPPVPRYAQGQRPWSASTAACLARHTPSLAVRTQWPSCWCRQRGQALTQKPGGITFQTLARREDRQRRTSGRSGTAADLQERSAIRVAPERGLRGGRNPQHGQSAAAPVPSCVSPSGGGSGRQGVAAVRARCRADGGPDVAWQPSCVRGQSSGDAVSAAALTGPWAAAQTGVPW